MESAQAPNEKVWGLLRRKGMDVEHSLEYRTSTTGERDTYRLGRSSSSNDIVVNNKRVSSQHCLIYCDYNEARMRIYVQDNSANGTFVNSSLTRLSKGERTELNSGDEIYLTNPRFGEDVVSFIFINMRERQILQKKVDMAPPLPRGVASTSTSSARHIEDYYIIGHQIGSGTCGKVHLCLHITSKTQYAVKIIDTRKFARSPGLSSEELRQEADMMRQLDHPNIIRIKDTFETDAIIFIVMELVSGGDLFDRIVELGKYTEAKAKIVMQQLLSAVNYLHSRNIVHRDLKPENILLLDSKDDVQVKITDFGLAKRANQEGLKTFCGTPQYFAPEVLRRQGSILKMGRYNFKADMWSLGVVLYIMLSGEFPFDAENLYDQVLSGDYSMSSSNWYSISNGAKAFVRGLMTIDVEERWTVEQALQHAWITDAAVDGESIVTASTTTEPVDVPAATAPTTSKYSPVFWSMRCGSGSSNISTTLPWQGWLPTTSNNPDPSPNDDILEYSSDEDAATHTKKPRLSYSSNNKKKTKTTPNNKNSKPKIEPRADPLQFSSAPLVTAAPSNKLLRQPINTLPELFNKYRQHNKDVDAKI